MLMPPNTHLQVLDLVQQVAKVPVQLRGSLAHIEVAPSILPAALECKPA